MPGWAIEQSQMKIFDLPKGISGKNEPNSSGFRYIIDRIKA